MFERLNNAHVLTKPMIMLIIAYSNCCYRSRSYECQKHKLKQIHLSIQGLGRRVLSGRFEQHSTQTQAVDDFTTSC